MSSGTLVVAPAGLPIVAAGAIVVAGAYVVTAGAVLVARAVSTATESAVRAIGESGAALEREIAAIEAAEAAGQWRRRAMADVVAVNARLRLVRERAQAAGVELPVPPPLALSAEVTPALAVRWVSDTEYQIARLHKEIDAAAPPLRVVLAAKNTGAGGDISAELDRCRQAVADRHAPRRRPVATTSLADIVGLLDPDATTAELEQVLADAAAIPGRAEQSMYFSQLRYRIVTELNPAIERRRLAATWVSALDDGPLAAVLSTVDPPAPLRGTARALREVVEGARDLTPELRGEGVRLMAWADETAGRAFVRDLVRTCLAEDGHKVLDTFEGDGFSGLRMARPGWADEHATVIRVHHGNRVEHHLEAARSPLSDREKATGEERCAVANAAMRAVAAAAAAAGVEVRLEETPAQVAGTDTVEDVATASRPGVRYQDRP
ncbi:hypothetical protein ACWEHA_01215 [Amycolatopsis nivea]